MSDVIVSINGKKRTVEIFTSIATLTSMPVVKSVVAIQLYCNGLSA